MIKRISIFICTVFTFQASYAMPANVSSLRTQISNYSNQINGTTSMVEIMGDVREMASNEGFVFSGERAVDLQELVDNRTITPSEAVEIMEFIHTLENEDINVLNANLFSINMLYYKDKMIAASGFTVLVTLIGFFAAIIFAAGMSEKIAEENQRQSDREDKREKRCANALKDPSISDDKFKTLCGESNQN